MVVVFLNDKPPSLKPLSNARKIKIIVKYIIMLQNKLSFPRQILGLINLVKRRQKRKKEKKNTKKKKGLFHQKAEEKNNRKFLTHINLFMVKFYHK